MIRYGMFRDLLHGLQDLIYPPHCLLCKTHIPTHPNTKGLCLNCYHNIELNHPHFCLKCSRHLKTEIIHSKCTSCRNNKIYFDFAWGACLYKDSLKTLIYQFKYGQRTFLRFAFAQLLANFIQKYNLDIQQFNLITPIPLSTTRFRERGYNQAQLLAEQISTKHNIPLSINNFIRTQHTLPQTHFPSHFPKQNPPLKNRWTNIHQAFKIKHSNHYLNKNILIIDDLLTTGATASEAARMLKQAGAQTVGVLTLGITQ